MTCKKQGQVRSYGIVHDENSTERIVADRIVIFQRQSLEGLI